MRGTEQSFDSQHIPHTMLANSEFSRQYYVNNSNLMFLNILFFILIFVALKYSFIFLCSLTVILFLDKLTNHEVLSTT